MLVHALVVVIQDVQVADHRVDVPGCEIARQIGAKCSEVLDAGKHVTSDGY